MLPPPRLTLDVDLTVRTADDWPRPGNAARVAELADSLGRAPSRAPPCCCRSAWRRASSGVDVPVGDLRRRARAHRPARSTDARPRRIAAPDLETAIVGGRSAEAEAKAAAFGTRTTLLYEPLAPLADAEELERAPFASDALAGGRARRRWRRRSRRARGRRPRSRGSARSSSAAASRRSSTSSAPGSPTRGGDPARDPARLAALREVRRPGGPRRRGDRAEARHRSMRAATAFRCDSPGPGAPPRAPFAGPAQAGGGRGPARRRLRGEAAARPLRSGWCRGPPQAEPAGDAGAWPSACAAWPRGRGGAEAGSRLAEPGRGAPAGDRAHPRDTPPASSCRPPRGSRTSCAFGSTPTIWRVDTHEEALTGAERDAGHRVLARHARRRRERGAGGGPGARSCAGFGTRRAAWIAQVT